MQKEINIKEIQIIIMRIILNINDLITVKDDKNLTQCCQDINERYNKNIKLSSNNSKRDF